MIEQTVQIISNERDTDLYFRLVVRAPQIAPLVQPGQFAHVRILPLKEALLRRPFSIYQVAGDTFSILYKAVGKGTEALSRMRPGDELSAIGPLGHGFTVPAAGGETPLLVAGGYGMAAMYLLAQRSPQKGIVFVGGRRRVDILCEEEFHALGWEVRVTTEDGSHGEKGLVTQPLLAELRRHVTGRKLFACGPTPMLKAVGKNRGGIQRASGTFHGRAHVLRRGRVSDVRDPGQGRRRLGISAHLHRRPGVRLARRGVGGGQVNLSVKIGNPAEVISKPNPTPRAGTRLQKSGPKSHW